MAELVLLSGRFDLALTTRRTRCDSAVSLLGHFAVPPIQRTSRLIGMEIGEGNRNEKPVKTLLAVSTITEV